MKGCKIYEDPVTYVRRLIAESQGALSAAIIRRDKTEEGIDEKTEAEFQSILNEVDAEIVEADSTCCMLLLSRIYLRAFEIARSASPSPRGKHDHR